MELFQVDDIIMVCSYCKKILNDIGDWVEETQNQLETYPLRKSHCICPDCFLENFSNEYLTIQKEKRMRI